MESKFSSGYRESKTSRLEEDAAAYEAALEENPMLALPGGTDQSVLVKAAIWFGSSKGRTVLLDDFIEENAHIFSGASAEGMTDDGSGHKIEYFKAHEEFLKMFEAQIEAFIEDEGASLSAFHRECEKALAGESLTLFDDEQHSWFVETLMASLEPVWYKRFHAMMQKAATKQRRK